MEWTKLADRLGDMPVVLAGPIVRRVTAEKATIWVATRFAVDATLELLQGGQPIATATRTSEEIGAHFHVLVITADVPAGTTGVVQYNLTFNTVGGPSGDLFAPFIIAETAEAARRILTYDPEPFVIAPTGPSFPLPPPVVDEIRILHGSCRKIAGDGKDGFPAIDEIMKQHFGPPVTGTRPTMLVLTGDNIYTDGSEEIVLDVSTEMGRTLLGFDEPLPGIHKKVSEIDGGRSAITLNDMGMTGARAWRAIGFGEVLALYLMTFSDVVWPPETEVDSQGFRAGMGSTRRILANIPTYMTFDDHEIGNSWNICYDWYKSVLTKPLGRRVYQNCLAGFAVCQAWGNTPEQFSEPNQPGTAFLTALKAWIAGGGAAVDPPDLQVRLGIPPPNTTPPRELATLHASGEQIRWDFAVACGPVHLTVLDVHTWTEYGADDPYEPARRMPLAAWNAQLVPLPSGTSIGVVVVSNVAIYNPKSAQAIRDQLVWGLRAGNNDALIETVFLIGWGAMVTWFAVQLLPEELIILIVIAVLVGITTLLVDAATDGYLPHLPFWSMITRSAKNIYLDEVGYNFEWATPPFERLVAQLADHYRRANDHAKVVILSGDVHHSYTMRLEYWGRAPFSLPAPPPPRQVQSQAVLAQLVSSPIKYVTTQEEQKYASTLWHFAGWSSAKPKADPDHLIWWNQDPWIAAFTPVGQPPTVKFDNTDPDWLYEIKAVLPDVPLASTLEVNPPPGNTPDHVELLKKLTAERAQSFLKSQRITTNSIGDISFDPPGTTVTHAVWRWWMPAAGTFRWVATTYEVDLRLSVTTPWQVPHV